MVRPRKFRHICFKPGAVYFKPRGVPMRELEEIILEADELEAIRLKNYQGLDQTECAEKMKISQSTFQRILSSANKKIANALILGKAIRIDCGPTGNRTPISTLKEWRPNR